MNNSNNEYLHIINLDELTSQLLSVILKQFAITNLVTESFTSIQESLEHSGGKFPDLIVAHVTSLSYNNYLSSFPHFQNYLDNNCKVIILTDHIELDFIQILINRGVQAILPTNTGIQEIVAAMDNVRAGKKYIGHEIWDRMVARLTGASGTVEPELKEIEQQIIGLMALPNANLLHISTKVGLAKPEIQHYYRGIKSKLKMTRRPDVIAYAKSKGYDKMFK